MSFIHSFCLCLYCLHCCNGSIISTQFQVVTVAICISRNKNGTEIEVKATIQYKKQSCVAKTLSFCWLFFDTFSITSGGFWHRMTAQISIGLFVKMGRGLGPNLPPPPRSEKEGCVRPPPPPSGRVPLVGRGSDPPELPIHPCWTHKTITWRGG